MTRIVLISAFGAALALATGPSPAPAAPLATASGPLVLATASAGPSVVVSSVPASSAPTSELARQQIFEILCGGMVPEDSALADHLWKVAGSLAERGWTPPRVTLSVVRSAEPPSR